MTASPVVVGQREGSRDLTVYSIVSAANTKDKQHYKSKNCKCQQPDVDTCVEGSHATGTGGGRRDAVDSGAVANSRVKKVLEQLVIQNVKISVENSQNPQCVNWQDLGRAPVLVLWHNVNPVRCLIQSLL